MVSPKKSPTCISDKRLPIKADSVRMVTVSKHFCARVSSSDLFCTASLLLLVRKENHPFLLVVGVLPPLSSPCSLSSLILFAPRMRIAAMRPIGCMSLAVRSTSNNIFSLPMSTLGSLLTSEDTIISVAGVGSVIVYSCPSMVMVLPVVLACNIVSATTCSRVLLVFLFLAFTIGLMKKGSEVSARLPTVRPGHAFFEKSLICNSVIHFA